MDYSPTLMSAHTLPTGFPQRRGAAFQLHDLFDPDSKHLGDLRASITLSRGQQFIRCNSPCVRRDKYMEDLIRSSAKAGIKLMNSHKPRWAPRQKSAPMEMWNVTRQYFDGLAGSSSRNTEDIRRGNDETNWKTVKLGDSWPFWEAAHNAGTAWRTENISGFETKTFGTLKPASGPG